MAIISKNTGLIGGVCASLLSVSLYANEAIIPNVFEAGNPAVASQVNDNFESLKTSIDDNFVEINKNTTNDIEKIKELNSQIENIANQLSNLEESELVDLIVGQWAVKSYNNGFQGEEGSITFTDDGRFLIEIGTISVFYSCSKISCPETEGTWEILGNDALKVTYAGVDPMTNESYKSAYPFVINKSDNKIVFSRAYNNSIMYKVN